MVGCFCSNNDDITFTLVLPDINFSSACCMVSLLDEDVNLSEYVIATLIFGTTTIIACVWITGQLL